MLLSHRRKSNLGSLVQDHINKLKFNPPLIYNKLINIMTRENIRLGGLGLLRLVIRLGRLTVLLNVM